MLKIGRCVVYVKFGVYLTFPLFLSCLTKITRINCWVFILGNSPTTEFESLGYKLQYRTTMAQDIHPVSSMVSGLSLTYPPLPCLCILLHKWKPLASYTVKDCSFRRSIPDSCPQPGSSPRLELGM